MKALVDPREPRICQVEAEEAFRVAAPLVWVTAPEGCTPAWSVTVDGEAVAFIPPRPSERHEWVDGAWALPVAAVDAIKADARATLARRAELERQRYITAGDGKAAIYGLKRDEAQRWQADVADGGTPQLADYPWIAARASRLDVSGQAVADEWSTRAAAWEAVGRAIEDAYEAAVEAIDALSDGATEEDAAAIVAGVVWPVG